MFIAPPCMYCKKFHGQEPGDVFQCDAYPEDIPVEIFDRHRRCQFFVPREKGMKYPSLLPKGVEV